MKRIDDDLREKVRVLESKRQETQLAYWEELKKLNGRTGRSSWHNNRSWRAGHGGRRRSRGGRAAAPGPPVRHIIQHMYDMKFYDLGEAGRPA